jgi:LysR family nitrogen assimilation transcriptional regulator
MARPTNDSSINLRQLRYFIEIAQLRSFSRAASSLRVAQSALSRQMQHLEAELGTPLLERGARGVSLTWAGERFLERAQGLLNGLAAARSELASLGKELRGSVSLGMPPSMFEAVTVPLLGAYRRAFAQVQIHVREGVSADLCEAVAAGVLDVAVVVNHRDVGHLHHLRTQPLFDEGLWLVGHPGGTPMTGTEMPLEQVATLPLIVSSRPNALRAILDEGLAGAGLARKPAIESNSARLSIALAEMGAGWAVLPYSGALRALREGRLTGLPIDGLRVNWVLASSRAQSPTPQSLRLQAFLEDVLRSAQGMTDWRLDATLRDGGAVEGKMPGSG